MCSCHASIRHWLSIQSQPNRINTLLQHVPTMIGMLDQYLPRESATDHGRCAAFFMVRREFPRL